MGFPYSFPALFLTHNFDLGSTREQVMRWAHMHSDAVLICSELPPLVSCQMIPILNKSCWLCSSGLFADDLDFSWTLSVRCTVINCWYCAGGQVVSRFRLGRIESTKCSASNCTEGMHTHTHTDRFALSVKQRINKAIQLHTFITTSKIFWQTLFWQMLFRLIFFQRSYSEATLLKILTLTIPLTLFLTLSLRP